MSKAWLFVALLCSAALLASAAVTPAATSAGPRCTNRFPRKPLCKFVDDIASNPLAVIDGTTGKMVKIGVYQIYQKFHRDLPATKQYVYGKDEKTAAYPGPVIVAQRGVETKVYYENHLLDRQHMFTVDYTLMPGIPKPKLGGIPVGMSKCEARLACYHSYSSLPASFSLTSCHFASGLLATPRVASSLPLTYHHVSVFPPSVFVVPHRHGGEQQSDSDGHPQAWFTQFGETGPTFKSRLYTYSNKQNPAAIWYHDHTLGWTRLNTVAGIGGLYVIKDPKGYEKDLGWLPSGAREVALAIADRMFFANGSINYPNVGNVPRVHPNWNPEYLGNTIVVNGKVSMTFSSRLDRARLSTATRPLKFNATRTCSSPCFPSLPPPPSAHQVWPYMRVRPAMYRMRLLNAANARVFNLKWVCAARADYPNFVPPIQGPAMSVIQFHSTTSDNSHFFRCTRGVACSFPASASARQLYECITKHFPPLSFPAPPPLPYRYP
ncbi:unnamed protein product [Closterium sp. NIES-53]